MAEQYYQLTVPFRVRSYEVDYQGETNISTICDYFQEAAGLHAQKLQFDISDLQKKGLTWVLYKMQVKIHSFPKRWEDIKVITWPSAGDGIRAYRDYQLFNDNDELLAVGLSQWMVLDIKKKRPVKIPDELMSYRFRTDDHVLELHKESLKKIGKEQSESITTASINDLDMNRHVNNVRYVDWITGYNLTGSKNGKKCRELIIQYASETKAGDKIYLANETNEQFVNQIYYSLFKNDGKKVIANALTIWE